MMADGGLMALGALVLLGTLTGFISGMLGIGGGTVVVPALVLGLPLFGITGPELPKIAMATSLALVVPTSIASAQAHAMKGGIDWRLLALLAPSIAAGAFITAAFASTINSCLVMLVFIVFALFTAWGLLRHRKGSTQTSDAHPSLTATAAKGIAGGVLSSLLGLGVGFFAVPMLSRFVTMPRAIGTAAALALPMAVVGTTGYLLAHTPDGCAGQCTGYVFLPAVAAIGITAVLVAPMGAWAAHALPVAALRRAFAVFLLVAATNLTYKTYTQAIATGDAERVLAMGQQVIAYLTPSSTAPGPVTQAPSTRESTPYFSFAARFGPQRTFLLLVRDDNRTEILPPSLAGVQEQPEHSKWFTFEALKSQLTAMTTAATVTSSTSAVPTAPEPGSAPTPAATPSPPVEVTAIATQPATSPVPAVTQAQAPLPVTATAPVPPPTPSPIRRKQSMAPDGLAQGPNLAPIAPAGRQRLTTPSKSRTSRSGPYPLDH